MTAWAYYNEIDDYAATWIENLIRAGHVAAGVVDRRDIRDVSPDDLREFTQCHFFAGIAVWSGALRAAGFPDDREVWTGSCPCQPFSAAGQGAGFADERHLWPAWDYLIEKRRPPIVLGEQVASPDGLLWNDVVCSDLEGKGYAFGAVDTCSAGITLEWENTQGGKWLRRAIRDCTDSSVQAMLRDFAEFARSELGEGGEHIRQRQYFVGVDHHHHHQGLEGFGRGHSAEGGREGTLRSIASAGELGGVADSDDAERRSDCPGRNDGRRENSGREEGPSDLEGRGDPIGVAHHHHHHEHRGGTPGPGGRGEHSNGGTALGLEHDQSDGRIEWGPQSGQRGTDCGRPPVRPVNADQPESIPEREQPGGEFGGLGGDQRTGPISRNGTNPNNGGRRDTDWLFCRDAKWRPVESGSVALVNGATGRVGKLRAYGNAIDIRVATRFIETYLDYEADQRNAALLGGGSVADLSGLLG